MSTTSFRIITVSVLAILADVVPAQTTLTVPGGYPTIQAAIDAALPGSTILVAPGLYSENISFNGKNVAVQSTGGPLVTTISAMTPARVVTFTGGEGANARLQGFRITGGVGGIICFNASPTITDCTVTGNVIPTSAPTSHGGGILCAGTTSSASPVITNCRVTWNYTIDVGGGIAIENLGPGSVSPTISGCTISNNSADGLLSYPNNNFPDGGGGIYLFRQVNVGPSAPVIDRCVITDNTTLGNGGGIGAWYVNTVTVKSSRIALNGAFGATGLGGGVYANSNQIALTGCLVDHNSAYSGGGLSLWPTSVATVLNCTIVMNSAGSGSGIQAGSGSTSVTNSIVWGNSGSGISLYANATLLATFSDLPFFGSNPSNTFADPRFVDPTGDDFHLASNSPCVNTGTTGVVGLPTTDLDGTPRIQGLSIDMGADEVPTPPRAGSNEDLDLYNWINSVGDPQAPMIAAPSSSLLTVRLQSPGGTFNGLAPLIAGEFYPSSTSPGSLAGFPYVHLTQGIIIFAGSIGIPAPFTVPGLPAGGLTLSYQVPAGLSGNTLRIQGFVNAATAVNGLFAATAAHEIAFP